ncbi:MAG: UDP-N-acetylmuramoyl-tripeptide--D-alanyl-D-alanine ligase [Saprospiraceae bacterium]|nr:UDP-N-acetylmuramoyl-tripeptide--D-alanyl-D-alanine ligase [Saprospiraceae bacterium]
MEQLYSIFLKHPKVFIDTRNDISEGIFVAVGQKDVNGFHRGNQFAEDAINSSKASYAIINDIELKEKYKHDNRFILVEDGEKTLQDLARFHRHNLTMPVLAIAGSNGKTTFKELLDAVLSSKYKTFSTKGNLNNHLGVPLSILSIDNSYEFVILEIGANHLEETRFLAEMILPDYGIVTNCGKDHLGEYGSVENIIKANKELYDVLLETDKGAFVSKNDNILMNISEGMNNRFFYGKQTPLWAEVIGTPFLKFKLFFNGNNSDIQTKLFGRYWLDTLLGVSAIGSYFDISLKSIKKAIEAYQPAALRSQLVEGQGNKVLLDCYNANPSSMEVFISEIQQSSLKEPKILVLGEMLELGDYSKAEHQKLIDSIDVRQFEDVIFIGEAFLGLDIPVCTNLRHFVSRDEAEKYLLSGNYTGKYFFVKGSRDNKLELLMQVFV